MIASYLLLIVLIAAFIAFIANKAFKWEEIWCASLFWAVCILGGYLTYLQEALTP